MTDLSLVLPAFPTAQHRHLIPSLEKNLVTTTDLLTLDAVEIAKRAHLPVLDVKRLCNAVLRALQDDLGLGDATSADSKSQLRKSGNDLVQQWSTISTLDDRIDAALGGGIPTGYITELTGESGSGKTQLLLHLLLSAQLPPPYGLSKRTLYISTSSPLPTPRLTHLLTTHPLLSSTSLSNILTIPIPDLESQDHILRFHLPVAIRRHNIGLVVLDAITPHYRAEFARPSASGHGANMAKRSNELVGLGRLLRDLARRENVAVVVANQVADRFSATQAAARYEEVLTLDHQQRFFTGWGDERDVGELKTPGLGLVWTSQVACRVALVKRAREGEGWRRWVKVVFCAWAKESGRGVEGGVEFEIGRGGVGSLRGEEEGEGGDGGGGRGEEGGREEGDEL